jgi:dolichol-phosphate mannosyltransferase
MPEISVVVPVYQEQGILHELCSRLHASLGQVTGDYEVILVDDGSRDGTWPLVRELALADPRVKGVRFSRNFGQHYAISAGLDVAQGEWVVVMDGDLQDRPEVIPDLYRKAREGYDVVFVSRQRRPEAWWYRLAGRIFYRVLGLLSDISHDATQANFSILRRPVVEHLRQMRENLRFYGGLVHWLGFRETTIMAQHGERFAGKPAYNLRRRLRLAGHIIFAHSNRPLYASIILGLVISGLSFVYGVYIVVLALLGKVSGQGWASLIVSVFFMGGIILIVLGIVGVYLGMVFSQVKQRPLYVVADRLGVAASTEIAGKHDNPTTR